MNKCVNIIKGGFILGKYLYGGACFYCYHGKAFGIESNKEETKKKVAHYFNSFGTNLAQMHML